MIHHKLIILTISSFIRKKIKLRLQIVKVVQLKIVQLSIFKLQELINEMTIIM